MRKPPDLFGIAEAISQPIERAIAARNYIAALDASTGVATAWYPIADWYVNSLAVSGSTVYTGGGFLTIGGNVRPYFAQFNAPPISVLEPVDSTRAGTALGLGFNTTEEGDGVASTSLWVKTPGAPVFADTGTTLAGMNGILPYTVAAGDGLYQYATKASDLSGNSESDPTTAGASILVNTAANSTFSQAYATGSGEQVFPMTDDLDVTVTLAGASAGSTVTVSRTASARAGAPGYFQHSEELLDESLQITGEGLGEEWTAQLDWAYDGTGSNVPSGGIDKVWRFGAGTTPEDEYAVTPSGGVITVTGIDSFSTWYAGNPVAVPVVVSRVEIE